MAKSDIGGDGEFLVSKSETVGTLQTPSPRPNAGKNRARDLVPKISEPEPVTYQTTDKDSYLLDDYLVIN